MSKYLKFVQIPFEGKTKRFEIISKSSGDLIGKISWYAPWRQYTFSPGYPTVWNKDCLQTVQDFIKELMREWKKQKEINKKIRAIDRLSCIYDEEDK